MIKYVFFDIDETLIDIKKAQNSAIISIFNKFSFNKKTNLEAFAKKWDELTHYHYEFYSRKEITYTEQRKRRVRDLFKEWNIKLDEKDELNIYDIYLQEFENN